MWLSSGAAEGTVRYVTKRADDVNEPAIYREPMSDGRRDPRLGEAFVKLADTLVDDFDVSDFLHILAAHCVKLLDVDAAGLMLADGIGRLRLAAASTERARLLELFELQNDEGPCLNCFASGQAVLASDLDRRGDANPWPRFARASREAGFLSVAALPLRLRAQTIGALNLFREEPSALLPPQQRLGQALADVATIGILQERGVRRNELLAQQLQITLDGRLVIEQAKGVLAERTGLEMDESFRLLRAAARSRHQQLSIVATLVVSGRLELVGPAGTDTRP
jgi:transcriptional regulator with GAF, ATPase, and Fis domain